MASRQARQRRRVQTVRTSGAGRKATHVSGYTDRRGRQVSGYTQDRQAAARRGPSPAGARLSAHGSRKAWRRGDKRTAVLAGGLAAGEYGAWMATRTSSTAWTACCMTLVATGFLAWHLGSGKRRARTKAALRRARARTWRGMTGRARQPFDRARQRAADWIAPTERSARAETHDRARKAAKAEDKARKKAQRQATWEGEPITRITAGGTETIKPRAPGPKPAPSSSGRARKSHSW